jgi:hypothetical protein
MTQGLRAAPGRAWGPGPPQIDVAQIDGPRRGGEDHRARLQVLLRCAWELGWVEWSLRYGRITGLTDKLLELGIGDLVRLDPETVHVDLVDRSLLAVVTVRSHRIRLSRNPLEIVSHVASVNTVFQSFLMLTTVQFSRLAVSSACSAPAV